jgi:meso-butanediol dehydrogenase / (S,S)-butanediol dehydrogenase / diacetyl reductase
MGRFESQWRTIIDVDLDGVFYACRAAIPVMAARGSGAIVTISSAIGTVGERNRSAYCAAKSGVENLTRAMALDHGREGIPRIGQPAEVAAAIAFLASDASFITGAVLPVDAGWTAA